MLRDTIELELVSKLDIDTKLAQLLIREHSAKLLSVLIIKRVAERLPLKSAEIKSLILIMLR